MQISGLIFSTGIALLGAGVLVGGCFLTSHALNIPQTMGGGGAMFATGGTLALLGLITFSKACLLSVEQVRVNFWDFTKSAEKAHEER